MTVSTSTGPFSIWEEDGFITRARWGKVDAQSSPLLKEAALQINRYFEGDLEEFDLPWRVTLSEFQRIVCEAIADIPFGHTKTYGEIAKELKYSAQAIGQGCGGNPIPLIIPCHRVVGAANLGGFSGTFGIETKVALLKHEGSASLLI